MKVQAGWFIGSCMILLTTWKQAGNLERKLKNHVIDELLPM